MSPQIAPVNGYIITLVAFVGFFLQSEFSSVSSNVLPEQMQSRIGCICRIFFQSGFLNVSSKFLPEQLHSCIGYICVIFLRSEFSNVSSNRPH